MDIVVIIRSEAITSLYQPIVELDSGRIVAYEALARGPAGSDLESPAALFAAAADRELTAELDWVCRAAAVRGALAADLGRGVMLFINVEPSTLRSERPQRFDELEGLARSQLSIVVEVTERSVVDDPAALIASLGRIRAAGMGVAIDDLGAEPNSLVLLPFVAPDVTKLDLRLIQHAADEEVASIAGAVRADAERRASWILAEGVETEAHLNRALVFGARLGQGWMFGRPAQLPTEVGRGRRRHDDIVIERAPARPVVATPWELVANWPQRRAANKGLLKPMSNHVEQHAVDGASRVVLSAFQDAAHFTPGTRRRYEELAQCNALVGVVAHGMTTAPGIGVRGGPLANGHPIADEWTVTVVGPHDAAALIARKRTDIVTDIDDEEIFDYVITHDRETVVAAARSLMQYLRPEHGERRSSGRIGRNDADHATLPTVPATRR